MEVDPNQAKLVSGAREWIASRIRYIRLSRGMTQRELSNRMEVHFTRTSDLELNKTDFKISTLLRAAYALGIHMEDMMKGCPGWGAKAAKPKTIIIVEYQNLVDSLVEYGLPDEKAHLLASKLLSQER